MEKRFEIYKPQKTIKSSFLAFFADFFFFFFNFALKTYGTLKILILGAQDSFHIILSYYVEGHVKQNSNLNFII